MLDTSNLNFFPLLEHSRNTTAILGTVRPPFQNISLDTTRVALESMVDSIFECPVLAMGQDEYPLWPTRSISICYY